MTATSTRLKTDPQAIADFFDRISSPDDVREIRIPNSKGGPARFFGTVSGYFDNGDVAARVLQPLTGDDADAVFVTLNPVDPELITRAGNRLASKAKATTSDKDIVCRRLLLIDCDPVRPAGISATDAEMLAALNRRDMVREALTELHGWPDPLVLTMSGNGGALIYEIDLPNDLDAATLVSRTLAGVAQLFDDEQVKIDTTVSNAARITKIPGTIAAKGDNTERRPWRVATAEYTERPGNVSRERLEAVARLSPAQHLRLPPAQSNGLTIREWTIEDLLDINSLQAMAKPWKGGTAYLLDHCLTSQDHDDGARLIEMPSGAIVYTCHHNRCQGKDWQYIRENGILKIPTYPKPEFIVTAPHRASEDDRHEPDPTQPNSAYSAYSVPKDSPPEWEAPMPFHEADLPTFPVSALPDWLGGWVAAEAETTQTPPDLAAVLGLGAVAAASARKVRVNPQPGWFEPVNLFGTVVLPPGSRKTVVFADATAPVEEYEDELASRAKQEIDASELKRRTLEAELQRLIKIAAGADGDERLVADADVQEVGARLAQIVVPDLPRLIVDDCSPERLASLLATQGGRVAVMSPEGDVFEIMSGKYSSGVPNFGVYLKGHAGDSIRVDRVGRAPELIRRPALTMALAIQPDVLQGLIERPGFRGRGLLGRFLYSLPVNTVGSRKVRPPSMPEYVSADYASRLRAIIELESAQAIDGTPIEYTLSLAPDAERRFDGFVAWLEPQLGEFGELAHISDWAGKLAGAVARIAGLLHTAEHVRPGAQFPLTIEAVTIEHAITIGQYFIAHARAAFAEMGADPVVEDAKHLVRWLQRGEPVEQTSRRDFFNATRARFRKVDAIDPALRLMTDHGYLREHSQPEPERDADGRRPRGRKPSPVYDVNPALYTQNTHITQNTAPDSNSAFSAFSAYRDSANDRSG